LSNTQSSQEGAVSVVEPRSLAWLMSGEGVNANGLREGETREGRNELLSVIVALYESGNGWIVGRSLRACIMHHASSSETLC